MDSKFRILRPEVPLRNRLPANLGQNKLFANKLQGTTSQT